MSTSICQAQYRSLFLDKKGEYVRIKLKEFLKIFLRKDTKIMIETARWIGCPEEAEVPVIRKTVMLNAPNAGRIEVTGLGFLSLFINGKRVTEDCFTPALTDYEPRDMSRWNYPLFDETTHRILYLTYDLAEFVQDGENVIEIQLAPGWYRQNERVAEGRMSFGKKLKALFAAEFVNEDDSVVKVCSDGTETWTPCEITYSNLYIGEVHDARLLDVEQEPQPVEILPDPDSVLQQQTCPPDRVIRTIVPKLVGEQDGKKLYDLGENTTIRICVTAGGNAGAEIHLVYGENKKSDYEVDVASTGTYYKRPNRQPQIQQDTFICSDKKHTFCSEYVWHACRYIEVEGELDEITAQVVYTDVAVISDFECDNELINWIYDAYIRSQLTNLHNCIPSDCPHRERLGYTGDGQITAKTAMMTLDMKGAYHKWIWDILDCQDIIGGHVQHTAPLMGGGGGPGGWGCAMIILPDEYDKHYDDKAFLEECYPHMQKWIAYLRSRTEGDLVVREEPKGWSLGDWATLYPTRIPEPFVNSCYFLDSLQRMERVAQRLGRPMDALAYRRYAVRVRNALKLKYYDLGTGSFCGGVQGADAYGLWMNLQDDERTLQNLVRRYKELDQFDTGFLGTEILVKVLMENGQEDLVYQLLLSEKVGSYHWMKIHGATTIWEYMHGRLTAAAGSQNHPMFGAPVLHFFDGFLGIQQTEGSVGYTALKIAPKMPKAMQRAKGSVELPCGKVSVEWQRGDGGVTLKVTVPEGVPAVCELGGKEYALTAGENVIKGM